MKMIRRNFGFPLLLHVLFLNGCKQEQAITSLPLSNPEAEGVSSQVIIDFLDAATKSKHEFQSFMFLRHGKAKRQMERKTGASCCMG